jgi:hypothetical protein
MRNEKLTLLRFLLIIQIAVRCISCCDGLVLLFFGDGHVDDHGVGNVLHVHVFLPLGYPPIFILLSFDAFLKFCDFI